jgi:predicted RNase H-like HicB family nuclease
VREASAANVVTAGGPRGSLQGHEQHSAPPDALTSDMKLPNLTAIIEPGEDGWFLATCPELDIVTQGEDPQHAEVMLKEAVELWLECASDEEIAQRIIRRRIAVKPLELSHA